MAIVTIQIPLSASRVSYGKASFEPDQSGALEVPDYVAKPLLGLAGVTGPDLSGQTSAALLAASDQDFQANYLFWAFGQPLPDQGRIAAASALLAARGEPAVLLA